MEQIQLTPCADDGRGISGRIESANEGRTYKTAMSGDVTALIRDRAHFNNDWRAALDDSTVNGMPD